MDAIGRYLAGNIRHRPRRDINEMLRLHLNALSPLRVVRGTQRVAEDLHLLMPRFPSSHTSTKVCQCREAFRLDPLWVPSSVAFLHMDQSGILLLGATARVLHCLSHQLDTVQADYGRSKAEISRDVEEDARMKEANARAKGTCATPWSGRAGRRRSP